MGRFIYARMGSDLAVEDRTLAHLQVAVMNKLRRNEPFMLNFAERDLPSGDTRRSFWMSPDIPLQFVRAGKGNIDLNRDWIEALIFAAGSANGLTMIRESEVRPAPREPLTG